MADASKNASHHHQKPFLAVGHLPVPGQEACRYDGSRSSGEQQRGQRLVAAQLSRGDLITGIGKRGREQQQGSQVEHGKAILPDLRHHHGT